MQFDPHVSVTALRVLRTKRDGPPVSPAGLLFGYVGTCGSSEEPRDDYRLSLLACVAGPCLFLLAVRWGPN
jgi:hypothetical protein